MFIKPAAVFLTVCMANFAMSTPAASPPTKRAMAQVITSCTKANTVALTFDDGPYQYLHDIVDKLDAAGAKGTFFFNGNNWSCIYDDDNISNIKYAYSKGHMIGSHTWAHKDLSTLGQSDLEDEIDKVEVALQRILGIKPAYMRPPYGNYNDLVRTVAGSRGLTLVNWDFDDGDSTGSSAQQSEADYTDIANKHPSTILALNHETYQTTADQVLPFALQTLKNKGYQFVTVAECLGTQPYQKIASPQQKDSSWTC